MLHARRKPVCWLAGGWGSSVPLNSAAPRPPVTAQYAALAVHPVASCRLACACTVSVMAQHVINRYSDAALWSVDVFVAVQSGACNFALDQCTKIASAQAIANSIADTNTNCYCPSTLSTDNQQTYNNDG